jgi:hypothetical protein
MKKLDLNSPDTADATIAESLIYIPQSAVKGTSVAKSSRNDF